MKNKIFCTMFFFLFGNIVIAQEDKISNQTYNSDYWNFSFTVGLIQNINSDQTVVSKNSALNYTVDISLVTPNIIGFFANYSSANFSYSYRQNYFPDRVQSVKFDYSQFAVGPRFYLNKINSYIDGGIGYNNVWNNDAVGVTLGVGGKIKITDFTAVSLTGRVIVSDIFYDSDSFFSLNAGLEMNSKKSKADNSSDKSKISLGILAGTIDGNLSDKKNFSYGAEIAYDVSGRVSILLNYIYSNYNYSGTYGYFGNSSIYGESYISNHNFTGGARMYLADRNIRPFFEILSGLYLKKYNMAQSYSNGISIDEISEQYAGITFGGGIEFGLIGSLSGLLKAEVSNYFEEGSYFGLSGGMNYRF